MNLLPVMEEEIIVGESCMEACMNQPLTLPYLAVWVCLKGKAVVQVNFENYLFKQDDVLVLSEDSLTLLLRTSSDFRVAYCWVGRSAAAEIAYRLPNPLFSYLWKSPHLFLEEEERMLLAMWVKQVFYISRSSKIYRRMMLCNHLQTFFLCLSEKLQPVLSGNIIERQYTRKELLCWKFWDLIGKYCQKHREVAFYAEALCITPAYLSQITRKFMNDSPKGLIERQVILEMKSLLSLADLPVKDIADRLHFEDASYMCRFFKRYTGMSLTAYRQKCKGRAWINFVF